ncbi:ubiquinol-cytochrome c reductase iron-sulfur subunit [Pseudomonadales bacterium]|nr:ubiquinol-cytochrome c reductase iron-sulfur subunit [Gammaproteobacteria bacterium]MDA7753784.1 ubiquinol-cytochrome c reductase iron-sulfur subunit [Pseudomonadales bacterium]MBT3736983.1 ubiquinol-cytochrome c reductase iron-sulfur subunit [Gammaproteobacteria bacterium]MDA7833734.1 ubiquinol-cytochrome c reductase iron-sulfur subunit [Pseudomonadales bacterium]MDB2450641.1 ubiquinol-cytochrome c reductase iron-sulfur subunit [Pseudomonadales bacterium]
MSNDGMNVGRRNFLIGATSVVGSAGVVGVAVPFLGSWNPSAKALAAGAPIKIDISRLAPGEIIGPIPAWRDKPVFVVKRSEEQLARLNSQNDRLADPDSDEIAQQPQYAKNETRSIRPEVLVLVGICTHLSCSPKFRPAIAPQEFDAEWVGGFYCPCHGSKFDLAGRVYSGVPAPTNLPVPPHYYESESVIVIGEDGGTA